jgi:hypothetical protein
MFSFLRSHAERVMRVVSCFVETIHDVDGIKHELKKLGNNRTS